MLKIEIDGKAVEVEHGSTIIDAADKIGVTLVEKMHPAGGGLRDTTRIAARLKHAQTPLIISFGRDFPLLKP